MTELEAAQQKRIAELEEELAVLTRQLKALTRLCVRQAQRTDAAACARPAGAESGNGDASAARRIAGSA